MSCALRSHSSNPQITHGKQTIDSHSCFKVRLIISKVEGPTDRISWLLNLVLVQLWGSCPRIYQTLTFSSKSSIVSLWTRKFVWYHCALYKRAQGQRPTSSLGILTEFQTRQIYTLNLYRISTVQLMTLINGYLSAMFSFGQRGGGLLRADKRPGNGPALSPVLAVAFMPKVEGQCRSAGQSSTVDI